MFKCFKREDEPKVILDHFFIVGLRKKPQDSVAPADNNFLSKNLSKTVLKESLTWEPYVKESFPKKEPTEKSKKESQKIAIFCFPEDLDELVEQFNNNSLDEIPQQQYVFVFTDEMGVQQYGVRTLFFFLRSQLKIHSKQVLQKNKQFQSRPYRAPCCPTRFEPFVRLDFENRNIVGLSQLS